MTSIPQEIFEIENKLVGDLLHIFEGETFLENENVARVYNPIFYAKEPHFDYLEKYAIGKKQVLFLGMNPGPFGMAQNGVPFGNTQHVKEFLNIQGRVDRPVNEHPKRKVEGLNCQRREISGERLWNFIQSVCGTPEKFFRHCLILNYFPLSFVGESGKNIPPSQLKVKVRREIERECDDALRKLIQTIGCHTIVAIGKYAETSANRIIKDFPAIKVVGILHPSPASPKANQGWEEEVQPKLEKEGFMRILQS